jgi:hypothetical protein
VAIKAVNEVVRERINESSEVAHQRFRDAVKPIYGVTDKGDPEHIGSALLLNLREGRFLLTAAHVIDWNKTTTLYLGANDFAPLQFEVFVTAAPGGDRRADHADFAIALLSADLASKLSGAKFITEAEITRSVGPTEGRTYTCLGYPNSKNKVTPHRGPKVTPSLGIYTSVGRSASQLPKIAVDDHHILVDHNAKYSRDESGTKVSSVALPGFSGGAIIDVGRMSADTLDSDLEPKLAALLIEAHAQKKVILGTRLTTILDRTRAYLQGNIGDTVIGH